jgi:hypothetical protein
MVGDIISERWAELSRNGGRLHSGIVGDFGRNPQPTSSKHPTQSPSRWRMTKMALAAIRQTIRDLPWPAVLDALKGSLRRLCELPRKRRKQQDYLTACLVGCEKSGIS